MRFNIHNTRKLLKKIQRRKLANFTIMKTRLIHEYIKISSKSILLNALLHIYEMYRFSGENWLRIRMPEIPFRSDYKVAKLCVFLLYVA